MSTKLLFGGATLAGASYYVYQQRLDHATQPESHTWSLPKFGSSKIESGPGERAGRQIDEAAAAAKDKLNDLQYDAGKKIDSGLSKLEHGKAQMNSWTSEKLEDLSDSLSSKAQDAKHNADALHEHAHRDDPKGLKKLGHDIKQTAIDAKHGTEERIHDAKDSIVNGVSSLKNTIVGEKNHAEHELNKVADRGSGWFQESKSDALAKDAQTPLRGWGETAEQSADAYHDSLRENRSSGNLFSWGRKDSEDSANAAYNDAKRAFEEAQRRYNSSKPSWFSWEQDTAAKRLHEEAKQQLEYAQRQLDNSTSKLNEWKRRARGAIKPHTPGSNRFYDWLRDGYPADQTNIDRTAHQSIRGWGDSAELFAKERADESKYNSGWFSNGDTFTADDRLQRKANSWERWANKKYDQTAQGAQEYYDDATEALKNAEQEARRTGNHWWSWGSHKSSELDYEARRNLEDAQKRLGEASENLSTWSSEKAHDLNKKFWSGADTAIHETKKGVDALNRKTLDGLDGAQEWVKDKK